MKTSEISDVEEVLRKSGYPPTQVTPLRGIYSLSAPLPAEPDLIQAIVQDHGTRAERPSAE